MTVVKISSPCSTKEVDSTKIALEPMYLLTISKVLVCIFMYLDVCERWFSFGIFDYNGA